MIKFIVYLFLILIGLACKSTARKDTVDQEITLPRADSIKSLPATDTQQTITAAQFKQLTKAVTARKLVSFAQTLLGTRYSYGSIDPLKGFDCSGFITYVFNHFNIEVPRSSIDFTNAGKEVGLQAAKAGDLILFTGTVDSIRIVGHMGIVTENADTLKFIHSTSGKADGVTVTALNEYYMKRFVKVIRILPD
jgi:cell wall-associated NlpC family hydrolase